MARNRVLLSVLGGLVLVVIAVLVMLQGGDGADDRAGVAVLQKDDLAALADASRAPALPAAPRNAAPDALPASLVPVTAVVASDRPDLPESYRRALGTLTGRVVEAGGAPVAGMPLELIGGRKSLFLLPRDALLTEGGLSFNPIAGSAVTGEDGRFRLKDLEPRTFGGLILDPGGPRAMLHTLDISPVSGQEKDLGDIVLPATATLKGRVVDERGDPIRGARVRATELPTGGIPGMEPVIGAFADFRAGNAVLIPGGPQAFAGKLDHDIVYAPPATIMQLEKHLPLPTAYTGDDGAFELTGVIPGLVLFVSDDGLHLPLVKEGVPTGAAGGTRDLGTLTMGDGVDLRGRVMNEKGEPIEGAEVLSGNGLGMVPAALLKGPVRSDAEGRFTVKGLREGTVWTAARTDRRKEFSAFSTDDISAEQVITLPAPRTLRVSVLDDKGAPIAAARVFGRITEDDDIPDFLVPPRSLDDQVTVDAKTPGVYVVSDLQPGKWELAINAPGFAMERAESDLTHGDGSIELRLHAARALIVSVVREIDGTPVEHAFVEAYQNGKESPDTAQRTDADGRARLLDLRPGDVTLHVTHPALAIAEQEAIVPPLDVAVVPEVVVQLMAGSSILGTVLENGGPPVEPLMVLLEPRGGTGDSELPRMTVSDLDGNFRFDQVEGGSVELQARSRNDLQSGLGLFESFFNSPLAEEKVEVPAVGVAHVTLVVGAELADIDTGFLAGQLLVNGRAAEGWKVRSFGKIRRTAVADASGRFDLGRIEAGDVTVSCSAPGSSLMEGSTETQQVALAKDEHKLVTLSFSTGGIRGRVISGADGRAVPGVRVRAVSEGKESNWYRQSGGVSGPDGSFSIDTVSTGTYRVSARADGYANSNSASFTVSEMQTVSGIEVRLARALHVSGTLSVSGTDEKPSWMWLVATSADGTTRDTSQVDRKTGAFEFDGLATGTWTLTLAADAEIDFAPLTMNFDHDQTGLQLVFEPGEVDASEGAVPAGAVTIQIK